MLTNTGDIIPSGSKIRDSTLSTFRLVGLSPPAVLIMCSNSNVILSQSVSHAVL